MTFPPDGFVPWNPTAEAGDTTDAVDRKQDVAAEEGETGACAAAPASVVEESDDLTRMLIATVDEELPDQPPPLAGSDEPEPDAEPPTPQPAPELRPDPVLRDSTAYPPLDDAPEIGDPGRQREIVGIHGPLSWGVSDTELDFATADPFEVRACSTRGASHRFVGAPRQDAFCLANDERWLVVAVADGVSQGRFSQVAAEIAARAACKLVLEDPDRVWALDWTAVANRISRRIVDEAKYRRLIDLTTTADGLDQVRAVRAEMATTTVVTAISRLPDSSGEFPFIVAVLAGDSGAFRLSHGEWSVVAGGKELDTTITDSSVRPLPGPSTPIVIESRLAAGELLLLTSDGIADPLGDGRGSVGDELAIRWELPPTAGDFFKDVNFARRSFDDDRTAVGVWVLPPILDVLKQAPDLTTVGGDHGN